MYANVGKLTLELIPTTLYVTLLDVISGKVLYRGEVEGATAPVHARLIENQVVVTYWNAVAKRTEMVTMASYDGMIDKNGLVPMANKPAINRGNLNADGSRTVSSYNLPVPVMQSKSYVLPRSVTG